MTRSQQEPRVQGATEPHDYGKAKEKVRPEAFKASLSGSAGTSAPSVGAPNLRRPWDAINKGFAEGLWFT